MSKFFNKTINLDIDFSKSKKGYFRQAHRDRDTRVISFLIYLNSIDESLGGAQICKSKLSEQKLLKRFPESKDVELFEKSPLKQVRYFCFHPPLTLPWCIKFTSDNQERVFIYGSYLWTGK